MNQLQSKTFDAVPIKTAKKESFTDTIVNQYNKLPERDKVLVKSVAILGAGMFIGVCAAFKKK